MKQGMLPAIKPPELSADLGADSEDWQSLMASLQSAGAARFDAVRWHYIGVLATRANQQTGAAQAQLHAKLHGALSDLNLRMQARTGLTTAKLAPHQTAPSPFKALLQALNPETDLKAQASGWRQDSPRVQAFRKQLGQLRVQKQVTQALAQAPQNAGPINSHMLVLRSLDLMQAISLDYLHRFMAHVDTLMFLQEAQEVKPAHKLAVKTTSKTAAKTTARSPAKGRPDKPPISDSKPVSP